MATVTLGGEFLGAGDVLYSGGRLTPRAAEFVEWLESPRVKDGSRTAARAIRNKDRYAMWFALRDYWPKFVRWQEDHPLQKP